MGLIFQFSGIKQHIELEKCFVVYVYLCVNLMASFSGLDLLRNILFIS